MIKNRIATKIEDAEKYCNDGDYKKALSSLGYILQHLDDIRPFDLRRTEDLIKYASDKSIEKAFSKMKNTVFE